MGNHVVLLLLIMFGISAISSHNEVIRIRRSIDLSAAHSLISDTRLPKEIVPNNYVLDIRPCFDEFTFTGKVKINMTWQEATNKISIHAHHDLEILNTDVVVTQYLPEENDNEDTDDSNDNEESKESKESKETASSPFKRLTVKRVDRLPKKPIFIIHLTEELKKGAQCEVEISFKGVLWETAEGLFRGSYVEKSGEKKYFLATHFRPNTARRLFPCFDEPSYKVPFTVSVSRPRNYTVLFNTQLKSTEDLDGNDYVVDHFETTPPISTYTLGFLISELSQLNSTTEVGESRPLLRIWSRPELQENLKGLEEKITRTLKFLKDYWGVDYPLSKLDIVALPGLSSVKPIDNWGLVLFKESELMTQGYYLLAQELVYQWLGSYATPNWWSDAHVNKAIVGFLAASTAIEIDNGAEFDGKWPMTVLYSIYYEFSKRYPHSRITGMKQETTCSKTELVLRMLNYTLGEDTFKRGLQKFIANREHRTFYGDDIWEALTKQAHLDKVLCEKLTVNDIAGSWITKDRVPVVTVTRNYEDNTATLSQRVYLRERPHDVPEQDKMLWYIPIIMVREDKLDFSNTTPSTWMKKEREIKISELPEDDKFIIINPEEIGPFPVNYDLQNWNLLANYLQTQEGRTKIPIYTRAKLLHDAWNLAYAGDLSFATAFNMTLFMKYEREHLVWNPVFTLIDHIGRHIDMSAVHKKFETYVRMLLTPLYEELGATPKEGEESWKNNIRSLSKTFLCRAGYRPCIEEAQTAYKKWMDSENPEEGNPVANQYICPVFKWGTMQEWEFGLQRIVNFPPSRKPSERTYLLKTLAGCPVQPEKIQRLLSITILEENGNFTENDILLIFSMLSGGSGGYTTLFTFLSENWQIIKQHFENKTNLWDNLISTATGVFTTQEGYDMVAQLYSQHQGDFGSAEHIIEKSLKNIKEETKWSVENLPVIEKWLDNYLKSVHETDVSKFMG